MQAAELTLAKVFSLVSVLLPDLPVLGSLSWRATAFD